MKNSLRYLAAASLALPACALAQQQQVKPPVARYWVNVETAGGMAIPGMAGMGSIMAGMMGEGRRRGRRFPGRRRTVCGGTTR